MRLCLDACVLYPTVMRELLMGAAKAGFFEPQWSARILEEWRRAALKRGPGEGVQAEGEIALLRAAWPRAEVKVEPGLEARLWLPDPADVHVLACAVACSADGIVTANAKDFPRNVLAEEGLMRADPDNLLLGFAEADRPRMAAVAEAVRAEAERLSGEGWEMRALLKKARLPRLGKALAGART
ncbi:RSP_2648 family PIN domain-containing protein [Vannielia litorea]|uniref:PIN domain-containing protein n=1 Tax=Vannielia litorea TaxID=1217970 RepID=A0A1N6FFQ7_9RHOB|nr:PIN domain-containing protein [Vannielia litorea]SIN94044.1 PIN domain-containing protein [Vannielia litorea]